MDEFFKKVVDAGIEIGVTVFIVYEQRYELYEDRMFRGIILDMHELRGGARVYDRTVPRTELEADRAETRLGEGSRPRRMGSRGRTKGSRLVVPSDENRSKGDERHEDDPHEDEERRELDDVARREEGGEDRCRSVCRRSWGGGEDRGRGGDSSCRGCLYLDCHGRARPCVPVHCDGGYETVDSRTLTEEVILTLVRERGRTVDHFDFHAIGSAADVEVFDARDMDIGCREGIHGS